MDKYTSIINEEKFSKLTLSVTRYPKSLQCWEQLINYLTTSASPINKAIDTNTHRLICSTYESLLFNFPYLENYYIDYALLEYRLGRISKVHKIFRKALNIFNQRSLLIWIAYLRICNEIVVDTKQLFKKYEVAEKHIGLHYHSGEFWEMYLNQLKIRCKTRQRYFIVLRKVLEIPLHSFSKFYGIWLQCIDDMRDLSELTLLVSKTDLLNKLKVHVDYAGRRGPYLSEASKSLRKFAKELYMVVQAQVMEQYTLFESQLTTQYYTSTETLIPDNEIHIWLKYLDFTIASNIPELCHLNFQRALIPLANLDIIWIKYAHWLIDMEDNHVMAKETLLTGIKFCLVKTNILRQLYPVLVKLNDLDTLQSVLDDIKGSFQDNIEESDDFNLFWDYIQYRIFLSNSTIKSRYESNESCSSISPSILEKIQKRLRYKEIKLGGESIFGPVLLLQSKENTSQIEEGVFKYIIDSKLNGYLKQGDFWVKYCELIFFDASKSYLEKRQYIVKKIWPKIPKQANVLECVRQFADQYIPEDIELLEL